MRALSVRKIMTETGKCAWCGSSCFNYQTFCSRKCEAEWTQWRKNNPNELLEGAFNVIGAGLSLLTGSDKPTKPSAAEIKQQREAEWKEKYEDLLRRAKERESDPEYQAEERRKKEEREKMDSWSLEEWYKAIDDTIEDIAKEIKYRCAKAVFYKSNAKLLSKLEKYREKFKEKIKRDFEILHSDKASSNKKFHVKWEMYSIKNKISLKTHSLTTKALNASHADGPKPLLVGVVLMPIVCIIFGIILQKPIIPILGFVISWFMFAIWTTKWKEGKIKFNGTLSNLLGSPYLAVIGIIAGFALHSFLLGLFGVLAGIALFIVACVK